MRLVVLLMRLGDTMIGGDVVVGTVARIHIPLEHFGQLLYVVRVGTPRSQHRGLVLSSSRLRQVREIGESAPRITPRVLREKREQ